MILSNKLTISNGPTHQRPAQIGVHFYDSFNIFCCSERILFPVDIEKFLPNQKSSLFLISLHTCILSSFFCITLNTSEWVSIRRFDFTTMQTSVRHLTIALSCTQLLKQFKNLRWYLKSCSFWTHSSNRNFRKLLSKTPYPLIFTHDPAQNCSHNTNQL